MWLLEARITSVVKLLNSTKKTRDLQVVLFLVSAGSVTHLQCSCEIFAVEFAVLNTLVVTEFSIGKDWEESLGRQ